MKVLKVTREYFETEDEKIYFFEPLEVDISVKDMQQIFDSNFHLVQKLKEGEK